MSDRKIWTYCLTCRKITPHFMGAKYTTKETKKGQTKMDDFIIYRRIVCSVCRRRTTKKLSSQFKHKKSKSFDKEGIDYPV